MGEVALTCLSPPVGSRCASALSSAELTQRDSVSCLPPCSNYSLLSSQLPSPPVILLPVVPWVEMAPLTLFLFISCRDPHLVTFKVKGHLLIFQIFGKCE